MRNKLQVYFCYFCFDFSNLFCLYPIVMFGWLVGWSFRLFGQFGLFSLTQTLSFHSSFPIIIIIRPFFYFLPFSQKKTFRNIDNNSVIISFTLNLWSQFFVLFCFCFHCKKMMPNGCPIFQHIIIMMITSEGKSRITDDDV